VNAAPVMFRRKELVHESHSNLSGRARLHPPGGPCRDRASTTHPVQSLDNYDEMIRLVTEEKSAFEVFVEVNVDS
jgi:hypothetical protein